MPKSINLLPDKVVETQQKTSRLYQTTSISILGFIFFVLINLVIYFFAVQTDNRLVGAQDDVDEVTREIRVLASIEEKLLFMRDRTSFFTRVSRETVDLADVWDTMNDARGRGTLLESVVVNRNDELLLTASSRSISEAALFLIEMRKESTLADFKLLDLTFVNNEELERTLSFKVQFFLKPVQSVL